MKYSETRNWTHPVHRPGFDDWPDADPPTMLATLDWSHSSQRRIKVNVEYQPNQNTITEAVERGDAVCTGLVYEPRTLFRTRLKINGENLTAHAEVDLDLIGDAITVHPAIVAAKNFTLDTKEAHAEYDGVPIAIRKGAPIAVVPSYSAMLPKRVRPPESVVKFKTDNDLSDGICAIDTNLEERDIFIRVNQTTRHNWRRLGTADRTTAFASLYLSAFTQALAKIAESTPDEDLEHSDTWRGALLRRLYNLEKKLQYNDDTEGIDAAEAAQSILQNPLGHLIDHWNLEYKE